MHESEQELRPCPFCGSGKVQGEISGSITWVECLKCSASGPPNWLHNPTESWNTRPAEAELVEALEECANDLAAEIKARYPDAMRVFPDMVRRYHRDMETVARARRALSRARSKDEVAG